MVNAPNFAPSANIGSKKVYEIEENSILIPDFYIHYDKNWLDRTQETYEKVKDIYTWDSKIEKAFFRGVPTSLHIELIENLEQPIQYSYKNALQIYDHFKSQKEIFPRLEAVRMSEKYPGEIDAKFNQRTEEIGPYVAMMRFWQNDNETMMRDELLDYFYGYFDSLESFNHWRYPICNHICNFENESSNLMATAWYNW